MDLSLIALGNMASNLLTSSVPQTQREALAQAFSNSLINAVKRFSMIRFKKGMFSGKQYRDETSRKISWGHWFAFLTSLSPY
ncbi:sulfatase family protein [Rodentibacter pneumotropicus]|uniref:Sulfatase family protein n=1 Tax=Rodentibacter pneumotropicus TaxID=758 RepID=A0A448MKQ7_9PAST|nr:sulfatase family protein [Rodentibacter pneumotropicus]